MYMSQKCQIFAEIPQNCELKDEQKTIIAIFGRFRRNIVLPSIPYYPYCISMQCIFWEISAKNCPSQGSYNPSCVGYMHFLGDFGEKMYFRSSYTCIFWGISVKICAFAIACCHFCLKHAFFRSFQRKFVSENVPLEFSEKVLFLNWKFFDVFSKKKKLPKFDSFSKKIWLFFWKFDGFERGKNHKVTWLIQK